MVEISVAWMEGMGGGDDMGGGGDLGGGGDFGDDDY
jgi:hypothetical protein